jgi:hypothetical protein
MKKLLLTIIGSAFTAFAANAIPLGDKLLLTAKLSGDQEVPVVVTSATGVASFLLNGTHDSLCVNVTVTGLSGSITGVHIRSGAPGVIGAVVKDLTTSVVGNTVKTVITGTDLSANLRQYLSGQLYINVQTAANANGEIRGQIHLETDWTFVAKLDGTQLVPVSTTTAYGIGVFNLSKDSSKIKYTLVTDGITGALTQARLNYGAKGANGAVALDITAGIDPNVNAVGGILAFPSRALIDSLKAGKVYIDLGTATSTNGTALRGQLIHEAKYLYFDAVLNGQQEVPPVVIKAVGTASLKLNANLDSLWYDVVATGVSGTITGAHFHLGAPGVAGPAVVDILPGLVANRITGIVTGTQLTKNLIAQLLRGELYVNLHTVLNPNGEIRGQIYRTARQGFTINLNGQQEVPPVVTTAKGSGIVSIDRDGNNAHFMIVTDGLVPSAGHFHKQVIGQNGPVVFDLEPYYNNGGTFGYWRFSDPVTPFTLAIANAFNKDSIYANVHTTANPNGEIRGQVIRRGECFSDIPTGIISEKENAVNGIVLYPNPSSDLLNINFTATKQSNVSFEIIDVLGKQVYAESFTAQVGSNLRSVFVNKLKDGLYFVKIQNENGQTIERFVKN